MWIGAKRKITRAVYARWSTITEEEEEEEEEEEDDDDDDDDEGVKSSLCAVALAVFHKLLAFRLSGVSTRTLRSATCTSDTDMSSVKA